VVEDWRGYSLWAFEEDSTQPFPTGFVNAVEEVRNQNQSLDFFYSLFWAQRTYSCKLAPP